MDNNDTSTNTTTSSNSNTNTNTNNGNGNNGNELERTTFESLSKPPSSVLEDGRFVYLQPANSSFFFSRSIAKYNLVKAEGGAPDDGSDDDDGNGDANANANAVSDTNANDNANANDKQATSKSKTKEEDVEEKIHPVQIASARINTHGISELSKIINLSSMIQTNEYFGLTSVVDKTARIANIDSSTGSGTGVGASSGTGGPASSSDPTASSSTEPGGGGAANGAASTTSTTGVDTKQDSKNSSETNDTKKTSNADEEQHRINELNLRSQYILKRKKLQYESSSNSFSHHTKKCKVIATTQHTIDSRLLELRKRWRLHCPNHGIHVHYPILPTDSIAIDVDIYARRGDDGDDAIGSSNDSSMDTGGGSGSGNGSGSGGSSMLGRIARMVPRFATIELSKEYDIQTQLKRHQLLLQKHGHHHHHRHHHRHHHHHGKHHLHHNGDDKQDQNKDKDKEQQDNETTIHNKKLEHKEQMNLQEEEEENKEEEFKSEDTIAQPLASSSNKNLLSKNNNADNAIPMLTLLFQIEKSSTGFIQSVSLSSNITSSEASSSDTTPDTAPETTPEASSSEIVSSSVESSTKNMDMEIDNTTTPSAINATTSATATTTATTTAPIDITPAATTTANTTNTPAATTTANTTNTPAANTTATTINTPTVTTTATTTNTPAANTTNKTNERKEVKQQNDNKNITQKIIHNKIQLQNDELLIQSLQHSLFCANVFDSIRQEIIHDQYHPTNQQQKQQQQQQQQKQQQQNKQQQSNSNPLLQHIQSGSNIIQQKKINTSGNRMNNTNQSSSTTTHQHIAWLSSEMEDSFLPPPSHMASGGGVGGHQRQIMNNNNNDEEENSILNNDNPKSSLSVIYCHEGEVKVQLNSEYSLIIKLVDVNNHDSDNEKEGGTDANMTNISKSGSQSPEQLHILCRLLLLQSQLVYHNNRQEQTQKLDDAIQAQKDDTSSNSSKKHRNQSAPVDYSTGIYNRGSTSAASNSMTMTMRQNKKLQASFMKAPCILQSCVGLGTKVILERKVRKALRHFVIWQKKKNLKLANHFKVEWLPSSIFDPRSQFTLSLSASVALDVNILGDQISVTSFGDDGGFRIVHFGTSEEFEMFLKNEVSRLERNTKGS